MTPEMEDLLNNWINNRTLRKYKIIDLIDDEYRMLMLNSSLLLKEINSLRSRLADLEAQNHKGEPTILEEWEEWLRAVDTFPDVRFANEITRLEDGEGGHYFRISLTESHATEWKSYNGEGPTL
jgi:hypothetical protein